MIQNRNTMNKIVIPLLLILGIFSCKQKPDLADYFGQTYPDSIPVIFAPDIVSIKGRFEQGISFTPDTREFAFGTLNSTDFSGEIYHSKKIDNDWTEVMVFEPLKNESVFLPYFSPNGKSLLYAKENSGANDGNTDIWMIKKVNDKWDIPKKMNPPLSSLSREANACMTYDETIYFSSNRNCIGKENCYTADLFYSKSINNQYQNVKVISECSSPNDEESIFISPNEDYIIFCRYTDNKTWMDLYISYRDYNNIWLEPQMLDSTINSKDWDRRPFVSIDNNFLFFTRLQFGEKGLIESDIYWVKTSKLFKPFVYKPIPDIVVQFGEKLDMTLPKDYFKDIDDEQLTLSVNENEFDWLEFDSKQMKLSGLPTKEGDFELVFTATDKFLNITENKVKITVKK